MASVITMYNYLFTSEPHSAMIHDVRIPFREDDDRFTSPFYEIMFVYMLFCCILYVSNFVGYDGFFGLATNHACLKMRIYCKMFEDALKSEQSEVKSRIVEVIKEQNRLFK